MSPTITPTPGQEALGVDFGYNFVPPGPPTPGANGAGSDVVLNADVKSTAGHLTVTAAGAVSVNADLTTGSTGTVLIDAEGGALTQLGTTTVAEVAVAEVVQQDMDLADGGITFRVKLSVSFKYHSDERG